MRTVRVYRITHIDNLSLLLEQGGLWCGNEMAARGLNYKTIGNTDLTASRSTRSVPCDPGGNLNDYVPFYFCPRSVMLYLISERHPTTYGGGQEPIIHLVSAVSTVTKAGIPFVFTDRHAYVSTCEFYNDPSQMDRALDWKTLRSREWKSTKDDPDRKERKMAEFLVHRFIPWRHILGIGVLSQSYKEDVERILQEHGDETPVAIKQGWYY